MFITPLCHTPALNIFTWANKDSSGKETEHLTRKELYE